MGVACRGYLTGSPPRQWELNSCLSSVLSIHGKDMLRALLLARSSCLRGVLMGATLLAASVSVTPAAPLPNIRLSPDGKSFVRADSGASFRVWGVNYDHDSTGQHGRLLEDYWETEWESVRSDF